MSDRSLVTLDEVVDDIVDRRGVTPLKLGSDFKPSGHRVISAKSIKNRRVDLTADDERYIDSPTFAKWMKKPLKAGDVILTSEAPLGEPAYVESDVDWVLGQRLFGLRTNPERILGRYLYYALQTEPLRDDILSRATGSVAQGIRQSELRKARLILPPLKEQEVVSNILGTLDDKIELNRRMASTLEEVARAIFKSWFIDFDPVRAKSEGRPNNLPPEIDALFPDSFEDSGLGIIPDGWRIGSVSELADIGGGSTPSTKSPEFWDGEHAWATPKDLSKLSHPVLLQTERRITDAGLRSISSGLYPAGTVLMSSRAPIGYLAISELPVAVNQGFIALRPKMENGSIFLLKWLETHMDEIHGRSNGSTFMEISKSAFRAIDTVLPPSALIEAFGRLVLPLYERLVGVVTESETLGCVRDTLLPKLISGEIELPLSAIPD